MITLNSLKQQGVLNFIFFWSEKDKQTGCLSQWFESEFTDNNILFKNCEQYMMYQKAILFKSYKTAEQILKATDPKEIKNLGREVKNFNDATWNKYKYDIVKKGNLLKFSQNENLKKYLLSTKSFILVEASPYDKIWGIGMDKYNSSAKNPKEWKGQNLLGFALMEVRDALIKESDE